MIRILLVSILACSLGCARTAPRVVLYCAQDKEFAKEILADFDKSAKIEVAVKYDTEANKSVSLYEEIAREGSRPRCDVFWNNEIVNTIRLERLGLLEPFDFEHRDSYPDWTRPESKCWQAFAARARILIVNTDKVKMAEFPQSILDLADPKWKGRIAMAKPMFGSTATHAACLFEAIGEDRAKQFFTDLKKNDVAILAGNKQVAERVAAGDFALGLTDSDDAIEEYDQKRPVKLHFLDQNAHLQYPKLGTLLIPNTVSVMKNRPDPEQAKALVNELLNPQTEDRLARKGGFQIPLQKNSQVKLHETLTEIRTVRRMDVRFEKAADRWEDVQKFLRDIFAR